MYNEVQFLAILHKNPARFVRVYILGKKVVLYANAKLLIQCLAYLPGPWD